MENKINIPIEIHDELKIDVGINDANIYYQNAYYHFTFDEINISEEKEDHYKCIFTSTNKHISNDMDKYKQLNINMYRGEGKLKRERQVKINCLRGENLKSSKDVLRFTNIKIVKLNYINSNLILFMHSLSKNDGEDIEKVNYCGPKF
jgi:hypothetical protein